MTRAVRVVPSEGAHEHRASHERGAIDYRRPERRLQSPSTMNPKAGPAEQV
jgi:hypothetical protein